MENIIFPEHITVIAPYKNRLRISKPCSNCKKLLEICGITKVSYSTGTDINIVTQNVADLKSNISKGEF